MHEIKRKDKTVYRESIYLPSGERITKSFLRKTDATNWKKMMEVDKMRGTLLPSYDDAIKPFKTIAEDWLQQDILPQNSTKTYGEYKNIIKTHFLQALGSKSIGLINIRDANALIGNLRTKGLKPKTINKITNILKQILRFAKLHKIIREYPFEGLGQLTVPQRDFDYYSRDEVETLLQANLGNPVYPVIVLAVNTGMRIGEILGLQWDKVNFNERFITVARTQNRQGLQQTTKTKRIRKIGINNSLEFLLSQMKRQNEMNLSKSAYVIGKEDGGPFNPDHFCQRHFEQAVKRAGLRKIRFHDLRHTYASLFMMNNGNLFELQKILGHTKVDMTMIYAHLSPDHLLSAANTVEFGEKPEAEEKGQTNKDFKIGYQTAHKNFEPKKLSVIS